MLVLCHAAHLVWYRHYIDFISLLIFSFPWMNYISDSHKLTGNNFKFSVYHPEVFWHIYTNVSVYNTTIYFIYIK